MTESLDLPVTNTHAIAKEFLPKAEMQKSVGELLDQALKDGILEEALRTPANILPLPLPSCPNASCNVLKKQIKDLLEDGVASGTFGLQQAERLRDLMSTYNKTMDGMAEVGELILPHLSDVQADTIISGFHGETKKTEEKIEDTEEMMRKIFENALASGVLERALNEQATHQPEDASRTDLFNFAPSERLVDQPSISKLSKLDCEDSMMKQSPLSPSDYEAKLQATERMSDVA